MKKRLIFGMAILFTLHSCEMINNWGKKKLDPEAVITAIEGGWKLNQSGAEESWLFSADGNNRTYVKKTRYDLNYGRWGFDGKNLSLLDSYTDSVTSLGLEIDNNLLLLDNLTLQRDSLVRADIEAALSQKLEGKWKSTRDDVVYEFAPGGYMYVQYAGDGFEDGRWTLNGNLLRDSELQSAASAISFNNGQLKWGDDIFTRVGDSDTPAPEGDDQQPTTGRLSAKGDPISVHSLRANLGNFGQVSFEPHWEDRYGDSKVHYYLKRGGIPIYEFPAFANAEGTFDGLRAVSARDINSDGRLDIIVMANYANNAPDKGLAIQAINGVYLNKGNTFSFDNALSRKINGDGISSVNDIVKTLRGSSTTGSGSGTKSSTGKSTAVNYTKYKADRSICRIRIASLQGNIDYERIAKLGDLGILDFEPSDNGFTRVYLGSYIGKYTAYKVLNEVKKRGYSSAFVVTDLDFINSKAADEPSYHTYQIASAKKLNVQNFNALDDQFKGNMYITYSGTGYRISLGVYQKDVNPNTEQEFAAIGNQLGYVDGFSKTIK